MSAGHLPQTYGNGKTQNLQGFSSETFTPVITVRQIPIHFLSHMSKGTAQLFGPLSDRVVYFSGVEL